MSFIKVTDPKKREALIKDFIETRKRIKDNFVARKVGESEYQRGLTKLFKPVTETQKATTKEVTEAQKATAKEITEAQKATAKEIIKGLRPIEDVPPPYDFPFSGEYEVPGEYKDPGEKIIGEKTEGGYRLGKTFINLDEENKNVLYNDGEIYTDSSKIYDIITNKRSNVTWNDLNEEEKLKLGVLIINSGAIQKDQYNRPNKLGGTTKWNNVFSHIWFNRPLYLDYSEPNDELIRDAFNLYKKPNKKTMSETKEKIKKVFNIEDVKFDKRRYETPKKRPTEKTGSGLTILPSDPNALIKRFDLLLASQNAGHSGVRNELVSIFDELKRQGVINTNTYKILNSIIKK